MRANECRWVSIRVRFLSLSSSSSLSSILFLLLFRLAHRIKRVRVSLKARGKSRLVDMVGASFWGREGEKKRGDECGVDGRVSGGGGVGRGIDVGVEGSFGEGVVW